MQSLKDLYYWKGLFLVFVKHYYELKMKNENEKSLIRLNNFRCLLIILGGHSW